MIGPTGVGKTEISRRLSKLAEAPFIKVEATKFTEVGYVGKDVEQIIRDLIEISIALVKENKKKEVLAKAQLSAENRVLEVLVGKNASAATKESYRYEKISRKRKQKKKQKKEKTINEKKNRKKKEKAKEEKREKAKEKTEKRKDNK